MFQTRIEQRDRIWRAPSDRRALTLVEMLMAITILSMMAAALAALAHAARIGSQYNEGVSNATQHGRVALERISRAVSQGYANENFPCAIVVADTVGAYDFPDTLVVWHPASQPVDPTGLPRFNEIVVYCPNPAAPNQLLEITSPSDTRTVPAASNTSAWISELTSMKAGGSSQTVLITDCLRTAKPSSGSGLRGAVRFAVDLRPSAIDLASFRAGTTTFESLPWVQTIYGSQTGLRQTWVKSELQLMPGYNLPSDSTGIVALPFFGSTALYWSQTR